MRDLTFDEIHEVSGGLTDAERVELFAAGAALGAALVVFGITLAVMLD